MTTFASEIERWRSNIDAHKAETNAINYPTDFLLAWIQVESGGNVHDIESTGERGLFQIHPDEAKELGLNDEDFQKVATDGDWSVKQGLRLAAKYYNQALQYLSSLQVSWTGMSLWKFAKLLHALPTAARELMQKVIGSLGRVPNDWTEFRLISLNAVKSNTLSNRTAKAAPKILATTDKMGDLVDGTISPERLL